MTDAEKSKIKALGLDEEIKKIETPTYRIKYIEGIGYVTISEGYLMLYDGSEPTQYFIKTFESADEIKKEILSEYQYENKK